MQSNDAPAQNSGSEEISHKNCRKNFTAIFLQSSRIPLQHQKDIAMDTTPQKNPITLLLSIEEIVRLAKEHGVEDKFYEEAEKPLKYLSKVLFMSKEEALVLSLFLELSPKWKIKISDLSEMLKISNISILSLMNVADELVKKGYIKKYDRNENDDIIGTHDWEDSIGSKRVVKRILQSFKRGDSPLITNNFLEPAIEDGMRQPDYYHFTDKAKEELFPEMDLLDKYTEKKDKSLIPYTSFAGKRLFYAPH